MRLLCFISSPPKSPSADAIRVYSLIKYLRDRDYKTMVILLDATTGGSERNHSQDQFWILEAHAMKLPKPVLIDPLFIILSLINLFRRRVWRAIWSWRPDVIFTSIPPGDLMLISYVCSRLLNIPLIVDVQDDWEESFKYFVKSLRKPLISAALFYLSHGVSLLLRPLYAKADCVTCVTNTLADILSAKGAKNIWIVPNAADLPPIREFSEGRSLRSGLRIDPNAKCLVLVVGNINTFYHRTKDIAKAVRCAREKSGLDIVLLLVGGGRPGRKILDLCEDDHEKRCVHMTGNIPHEEVSLYISVSDVGVAAIPFDKTYTYMIPMKVYEYLACGKPVVVMAPEGELASLIRRHNVGLVAHSEDMFCDAIARIFSDEGLLTSLTERAQERTHAFGWDEATQVFYQALESLQKRS